MANLPDVAHPVSALLRPLQGRRRLDASRIEAIILTPDLPNHVKSTGVHVCDFTAH